MRYYYVFFAIFIALSSYGKSNLSDSVRLNRLQYQVQTLEATVKKYQSELQQTKRVQEQQKALLDSQRIRQEEHATQIVAIGKRLDLDLTKANEKIDSHVTTLNDVIGQRTLWVVGGLSLLLLLSGVIYAILRRRIRNNDSSVDTLRTAQDSLQKALVAVQEESAKVDNKLIELLEGQIEQQTTASMGKGGQEEHSLALKVADEIVRIETNLSRMDASVKGYKQLAKAVERIRTNFMANGYEIVEMLGKPYNEGMKLVANFVADDTLAVGEQKITGIIKPQINYNGKMIQAAQITVSQNI